MVHVDNKECRTHLWQMQLYIVYKWLRLLGLVIHFEHNNSESANVIGTVFNQIDE